MLLLRKRSFDVESDTALVTGAEAATVAQAADIIAAAEAEAARIVEKAKAAYADEKTRGYADGLAAARQDELVRKLNLVDDSIVYMEKVERRMGELVIQAIRKCVGEVGDDELVYQVVRKSLQAIVRSQREVRIKVAPEMAETVRARLAGLLGQFPSVTFAEVVADDRLKGTACVVETDAGAVEASVDGQLAALEKSIKRNF